MPTPDLILPKPFVLIPQGQASVLGAIQSGTGLGFGAIALIYETSDAYEIGDTVTYDTRGQSLITYDNVEYALIEENKIINKEIPPP